MKSPLRYSLLILFLLVSTASFAQGGRKKRAKAALAPIPEGLVPDSTTARRIAEAVWMPIYGRSIYRYTPFQAVLQRDSVWVVKGRQWKDGPKGSVPYMEINRRDGRILQVAHVD